MNLISERRKNYKNFNNYFSLRYISVITFFLIVYCSLYLYVKKDYLSAISLAVIPILILLINFYTAQVLNGKQLDKIKINKCLSIIIIILSLNIIFSIINSYVNLVIALTTANLLTLICYKKIKNKSI
ncbi:hypothetical protein J2Z38_001543 [Anaerococcus degeneri]|nr:hypothetical protein [Anaerococcus degeneri]